MTQTLPTFGAGVWSLMLLAYSSGLCHASANDCWSPANSDSQPEKVRKNYANVTQFWDGLYVMFSVY